MQRLSQLFLYCFYPAFPGIYNQEKNPLTSGFTAILVTQFGNAGFIPDKNTTTATDIQLRIFQPF